jgi:homoserine O-acetyltransferase
MSDPEWKNGEYAEPPLRGMRAAMGNLFIMTSAPLVQHRQASTRVQADSFILAYIDRQSRALDANDVIYAFEASRDYDPSPHLARITVPVLAINSADDFVNPPELGLMEKLLPRVKRGKFVLIPISDRTRGHGTHSLPAIWKSHLVDLLKEIEH